MSDYVETADIDMFSIKLSEEWTHTHTHTAQRLCGQLKTSI